MAVERGIFGLIAFALVVVALFRTLRQVLERVSGALEHALAAGLIASFVAFFVHSFFDVSYYDYKVLLLFWLLVGIAARLPRLLTENQTDYAHS